MRAEERKIENYDSNHSTALEQRWDPESREELILKYAPLIHYIASRIRSRLPAHVELGDLVNAGVIGFIDALNRFDPGKNIQFKTYAEYRVRGAVMDEVRSMDWVPRSVRKKVHILEETFHTLEQKHKRPATDEEAASALEMDLASYYNLISSARALPLFNLDELGGDIDPKEVLFREDQDPSTKVWFKELGRLMGKAIESLPEKERMVVTLYYYEELTMKEIAAVIGVTESRVSQLHTKAIIRLKKKLKREEDLSNGS